MHTSNKATSAWIALFSSCPSVDRLLVPSHLLSRSLLFPLRGGSVVTDGLQKGVCWETGNGRFRQREEKLKRVVEIKWKECRSEERRPFPLPSNGNGLDAKGQEWKQHKYQLSYQSDRHHYKLTILRLRSVVVLVAFWMRRLLLQQVYKAYNTVVQKPVSCSLTFLIQFAFRGMPYRPPSLVEAPLLCWTWLFFSW